MKDPKPPTPLPHHHAIRHTLLIAAVVVAGAARGGDGWTIDQVAVTETLDGQPGAVSSRLERARNGDVRIQLDLSDGNTRTQGTLLLIAGKWLASRDLPPPSGRTRDFVDAAALNSQLVAALLRAALPQGPPAPGKDLEISMTEAVHPIHVSTATAAGDFAAPWTLAGSVRIAAPASPAEFHLTFRYRNEGRDLSILLVGSAGAADPQFAILDATPLAGWRIEPLSSKGCGDPIRVATVGELRARDAALGHDCR